MMPQPYQFSWRAFIGFELSWCALVYWQQLALLPVALYVLYGLWQLPGKGRLAVLATFVVGVLLDSALVALSVLEFSDGSGLPMWFMLLWLVFALAAVEFMSRLLSSVWLAAFLGATAGPLSYYAGAALSNDALRFPQGAVSLLVLALCWALLSVLLGSSRRLYA